MAFVSSHESFSDCDGLRYVVFQDGDFTVRFDTHNGGIPMGWFPILVPNSIVFEHQGAGFQITANTGQGLAAELLV